jgi:thiol-disulfide isomerase/thioredoxin
MQIKLLPLVLAASLASVAQAEPPRKGVIILPAAPTVAPAGPGGQAAPAKPAEPDTIDAKAKAILDKAVAAARALKRIEYTSVTEMKGATVPGEAMPAGFGKPHRVSVDFVSAGAAAPFAGRMRFDRLDGDAVTASLVIGDKDAVLLTHGEKTFSRSDEWPSLGMDFMTEMPQWIVEARSDSPDGAEGETGGIVMPASKVVSARYFGVEKLDGVDCEVIGLVREIDLGEMAVAGGVDGGDAEGGELDAGDAMPAGPTKIRIRELLAVAQADSLPRRVAMVPEMPGMPEDFEPPVMKMSAVKIDPEFPADRFATAAPEGFTEVAPPAPMFGGGGEMEQPELAVKVGDKAPDFKLTDLVGGEVTLASLKGKVVLLDFWATWCGPCKAAMPVIQKLHDEYASKGVAVLGVNTWEQNEKAVRDYIASKKYTYPCLLEGDKLAEAYGVPGIPTLVVIGKDGKVALVEVGLADATGGGLRKAIDAALGK